MSYVFGIISDTHGLLRPEAVTALRGVDRILHAGDVGDPRILEELSRVAPVTAIRGNIDRTGTCAALPAEEYVQVAVGRTENRALDGAPGRASDGAPGRFPDGAEDEKENEGEGDPPAQSVNLYMVHDVAQLSLDPGAAGVQAVIFGHTHKPLMEQRRGILFFNPGAAGPRRFSLPVSVGLLRVKGGQVRGEHIQLL